MKHIIILLLIFSSAAAKAQHPYIPIPKDSAVWVYVNEHWNEGQFPPPPHTFSYTLGRMEGVDTIVNTETYHCYYGDWSSANVPLLAPKSYPAKHGNWLREDTITKKIWYVRAPAISMDEELLYDFSLQEGDTITDTNYYYFSPNRLYPHKAWIDKLDSVYWQDGTWRYRWWIKSNYGGGAEAVMIEGLGYTSHFIDDPLRKYHPLVSETKTITCFHHKNVWLYKDNNPWNYDCDSLVSRNMLSVDLFTRDISGPVLYPNPVSNYGEIHFNNYAGIRDEYHQITVYNATGQNILTIQLKPGEKIPLQNHNLHTGIYFFIVANTKQQLVYKQRIMIV